MWGWKSCSCRAIDLASKSMLARRSNGGLLSARWIGLITMAGTLVLGIARLCRSPQWRRSCSFLVTLTHQHRPLKATTTAVDRLLIALDAPPWSVVLRLIAGFLVGPLWLWLSGARTFGWTLFAFFLGVLATFRGVPAVCRKLLPFADPVRAVWADRRQLAKRFDSYQWRKLIWFGSGMLIYSLVSTARSGALLCLIVLCLVAGALGQLMWRLRASSPTSAIHASKGGPVEAVRS